MVLVKSKNSSRSWGTVHLGAVRTDIGSNKVILFNQEKSNPSRNVSSHQLHHHIPQINILQESRNPDDASSSLPCVPLGRDHGSSRDEGGGAGVLGGAGDTTVTGGGSGTGSGTTTATGGGHFCFGGRGDEGQWAICPPFLSSPPNKPFQIYLGNL